MKTHPTGTAYFLMAIFLALVVFLIYSLTYDEYRTKFMPVMVSSITLILTVIALIQELRGPTKTNGREQKKEEEGPKKTEIPLSRLLNAFVWMCLLVVGVYVLGFYISIPLWVFFYLWRHGHRWWSAGLQGAGAILIVYLVFVFLLQVDFYPGLFG